MSSHLCWPWHVPWHRLVFKTSYSQTCAKVPKRSEILGSLSPRSGTLMDLGPCTSFFSWDSGNPGPQDFDMQRDPGNPGPQKFDSRKTLETQDLKIWMWRNPGKWKPRTQNLKILMSRDFKVLGPYTIQYGIECRALCQGVQQVINSDDRTPKTWIVKNNATHRTHPAGGRL